MGFAYLGYNNQTKDFVKGEESRYFFPQAFCLFMQLLKKEREGKKPHILYNVIYNLWREWTCSVSVYGYCHVLKETLLLWACNYIILRLDFRVYWDKVVIHRDGDILAFSTQHGNSEIYPRRNEGESYMSQLLFLMRINLQGCQELDSSFAKSLFYICMFLSFFLSFFCHLVLLKKVLLKKNWLRRHRCYINVGSIPMWKPVCFLLNMRYLLPLNPKTPSSFYLW